MLARTDDTAPYEFMGPTLLSKQPPSLPAEKPKPNSDWNTIYTHLELRLAAMRAWRWPWWASWAILARFFVPFRYVWLVVANRMWRGHLLNESIIDSTGQLAVRTCKSGMWTGLTSPSRPWFKLGIGLPWVNLDEDGKAWLEDTEQRAYTVLGQSNFYDIMAQAFEDTVVFAQAPILVYEDSEDVCRFYLPCAGEYYLDVGARLTTDTFFTEFTLNVKQIVEQFTLKACPEVVRKLWQQGAASLSTEFVVARGIEPNYPLDSRKPGRGQVHVVPQVFTWREVYWLKGIKTERPLSVRGFHGQPFGVLMWKRVSNDPYCRSPCMDALGDTKQTQVQTLHENEFLEKGIRPPMGANPELKNEPASIMPAMITYMSTDGGKKGFWPLFEVNPAWLAGIREGKKEVNARIDKCLFVDLFMAISRMEGVQPRNELELTKRDLERLQELGPVITLVEGALDIILRRVLDILTRRKMLKPMPRSLMNIPLKITYTSIMRLAQKSAEAVAMKDGFATAGALSSAAQAAGVPDPIRIINLDDALREYLMAVNFPNKSLYTPDQIAQHDQIRAKAQQQAQIPGQAAAAVSAAKTLADTKIEPGNALSAMLPQGGVQ